MDKDEIMLWTVIGGIFIIMLGLMSIVMFQEHNNNKVVFDVINKNLTGNEAVIYCIENLEYIGFDFYKPNACYDLFNTRNIN